MSLSEKTTTLTLSADRLAEQRMRADLGLEPNATFARRDPEPSESRLGQNSPTAFRNRHAPEPVPDALRERLAVLEEKLQVERSERVTAQKALAEARAAVQQLQTKLAHSEIAAAETLEAERKARLEAQAQLDALTQAAQPEPANKSPPAKKRGRPPSAGNNRAVVEEAEPEPVKWWLPGYGAKKRR